MTITPEQVAAMKAEFEEWFVKNYPPRCIISKPDWHAPKIFRAATCDMAALIAEQAKVIEAADRMEDALLLARKDIFAAFEAIAKGASESSSTLPIIDRWLSAYRAARENDNG